MSEMSGVIGEFVRQQLLAMYRRTDEQLRLTVLRLGRDFPWHEHLFEINPDGSISGPYRIGEPWPEKPGSWSTRQGVQVTAGYVEYAFATDPLLAETMELFRRQQATRPLTAHGCIVL